MSVYYESLCPDSIRFVTQQLYPNWLHFGPEILTVDLNPFGKANVSIECPYMCCLHVARVTVLRVRVWVGLHVSARAGRVPRQQGAGLCAGPGNNYRAVNEPSRSFIVLGKSSIKWA